MKIRRCHLLVAALLLVPVVASAAEALPQGTVNLNTASLEQLQYLPRVGPALAGRIVAFREANGPFRAVEEVIAVQGIGETSLKNLSPYLSVSGETTLAEKVHLPRKTTGNEAPTS